jgi:RNA polymerase sigma factor (sigma-70 family)
MVGFSDEVIAELVRKHRSEMIAFVQRSAGRVIDPDDVVQQAIVRALKAKSQLMDDSKGRAWLFRIVRNQLVDELRKLDLTLSESTLSGEEMETPPSSDGDQACKCVLALAKTLKLEYCMILEQAVLEDEPLETIAGALGVTSNNAMVRLHRARRALRKRVEEHCGSTSMRACLSCVCEEQSCAKQDAERNVACK